LGDLPWKVVIAVRKDLALIRIRTGIPREVLAISRRLSIGSPVDRRRTCSSMLASLTLRFSTSCARIASFPST
jgi:hypothetical protein